MVYMNADNDLEEFALQDLNEMEQIGSSDDVNIVVQVDRTPGYDSSNGNWTGCRRYRIIQDADTQLVSSPVLEDLGEVDMGDPADLQAFLAWARAYYPAQHYALDLWNHGAGFRSRSRESGGVTRGFSYDDTQGTHILTTALPAAIAAVPPLDVLLWDASLMQMVEIAYQVGDAATFMVGSEESPPGDGYLYDAFLQDLVTTPSLSPEAFSAIVVNDTIAALGGTFEVTQSAVRLSAVPKLVQELHAFAGTLAGMRTQYATQIDAARTQAQRYGSGAYTFRDYKDLQDYAEKIKAGIPETAVQNRADAVIQALHSAIVAEGHAGASVSRSHGLSVYVPPVSDYVALYDTLRFANDTVWDEFLRGESLPLTVGRPNGGERWQRGATHELTWTTNDGVGTQVKLELYKGGALARTLAESTGSDASYVWAIPTDQELGTDYRVKITSVADAALHDESDADFEIASAEPAQPAEWTFMVYGWTMASVPLEPDNPAPAAVFGADFNPLVLYGWGCNSYTWLPGVHFGAGYWLLVPQANATVTVSGQPGIGEVPLTCGPGWQMLGCVADGVALSDCQLRRGIETKTWAEAVTAGWIADLAYGWSDVVHGYVVFAPASQCVLEAWKAYWVLPLVDGLTLIAPAGAAAPKSRVPQPAEAAADGWSLLVEASCAGGSDTVEARVRSAATPGFDGYLRDLPKAPSAPSGVTVEFVHPEWQATGAVPLSRFQTDTRAPVGTSPTSWDFQVRANEASSGPDVALTTPDLSSLPNHLTATLIDLDGGKTQYLRTTQSYRFALTGETPRRFRLVVEPRSTSVLRLSGLAVVPTRGGGLTVQYALNKPAAVQATIRSATGRVVGTMVSGHASGAGLNALTWDSRATGKPLPRGTYVVELTARTEEGQAVRRIGPVSLR
jgi:hypothetical protein